MPMPCIGPTMDPAGGSGGRSLFRQPALGGSRGIPERLSPPSLVLYHGGNA